MSTLPTFFNFLMIATVSIFPVTISF
uniref:Uncharacterized protein n=1 Tax=Rhizophora mucronata TaxID=61149 RepID=A0A2P2PSI6_RHIMU